MFQSIYGEKYLLKLFRFRRNNNRSRCLQFEVN